MSTVRYLRRYRDATRMNHWYVVLMFIAAALSGLAFFHPSLFFFSAFFGGGQWTRILHPFFGLGMVGGFAFLFFTMWRENVLDRADREWLAKAPEMLKGNKEGMPAVGKYNAGQKLLFFTLVVTMIVLLLSGIVIWRQFFSSYFPIGLIRFSALLHAFFAFVIIVSIVVHIYAGFWVKGSIGAMTRGFVTYGWARKHHRKWFEEVMRKSERGSGH